MPSTCIRSANAARSMALSVPKWCSSARLRAGRGGARGGRGRAKGVQRRPLAGWPDAGDLLEAALAQIALAPGAVRADGETVRLVAQPLDEIQHRIARRQLERVAPGNEEGFAAGV